MVAPHALLLGPPLLPVSLPPVLAPLELATSSPQPVEIAIITHHAPRLPGLIMPTPSTPATLPPGPPAVDARA